MATIYLSRMVVATSLSLTTTTTLLVAEVQLSDARQSAFGRSKLDDNAQLCGSATARG